MAEAITQTETTTVPTGTEQITTPTETKVEAKVEAPAETKPEPVKGKDRSLLTLKKDAPAETDSTETVESDKSEKSKFEMPEKMKGKTAEEIAEMYVNLEKRGAKPAAPESYDFEGLKEHGLTIYDEQHGADTTEMLKELGLSQEQVTKAIPHWKKQAERLSQEAFTAGKKAAVVEEFGEPLDKQVQFDAINKEWGNEARSKVEAISAYADSLPEEANWPLKYTAWGLKVLERMMGETNGPPIITDSSATDDVSLESKLAAITSSDRYKKPNPQRPAAIAEADRIAAQLSKLQQ